MRTIFAQATARGKAGVAVIRISGPDAFPVSRQLVESLPLKGQHALRTLKSKDGRVVDQALVLRWDAPHSFTGEDCIELHVHGSVAVVHAVYAELEASGLARLAEAGEFTQRALMNEKLDLSQVEGLGDLLDAETEAQRDQAFHVFAGGFSEVAETWRANLLRAMALLEATIDFVDEDVPIDVFPEVQDLLGSVKNGIFVEIEGSRVAERVRDGFEVAIVGSPNSGKSTLLNTLAGRDIAITSEVAGTTRDVIEARLDVGGLPVTFLDTAGVRETDDAVEKIGVQRALERARSADLRILLQTDDWVSPSSLMNSIDFQYQAKDDTGAFDGISGLTGIGVERMLENIEGILTERVSTVGSTISERQRSGCSRAILSLEMALQSLKSDSPVEIVSAELSEAVAALDSVLGRVDVEDVLGQIFSSFCIGK